MTRVHLGAIVASLLVSALVPTLVACSGSPGPDPGVAAKPTAAPIAAAAPCAEGTGNCDGERANGCETALASSAMHCGACGNTCAAGAACVAGNCQSRKLLAASAKHACAVTAAGTVRCWGDNSGKVVSPAARETGVPVPTAVEGVSGVVSVATDERSSCALLDSGKVTCWGEGKVKPIPFLTEVTDIALGNSGTLCVATQPGDLKCIDLTFHDAGVRAADAVPALHDITAVAGGISHFCALHKSGQVTCWGDPELTGGGPRGPDEGYFQARKKPIQVDGITDAVQIAAGDSHTCVVRANRRVSCWGSNWHGELGDGSRDHRYSPVEVKLITDATSVAVGTAHTCVVRATGELACWGAGDEGQLGGGTMSDEDSTGPVAVQGIKDAVSVAAGATFSCATQKTGVVSCWGSTSRGALGRGTQLEITEPKVVSGISGAMSVVAGDGYACALDSKGHARCWGSGQHTWEEGGDETSRGLPPEVVGAGREIVRISATYISVCAVPKAGDPFCFEGHRKADDATVGHLATLSGVGAVKELSRRGRSETGAALLASGQVILFKQNADKPDAHDKLTVPGLSDITTIAATDSSVCGVRRSGRVACVAFTGYMAFRAKDPVKPTAAIELPEIKDAASVLVGGGEYCVIRKTGEALCFSAWNLPRPLSPGQKPSKDKPRPIELRAFKQLTSVVQMATSSGSRCALLKSGEVSCWGGNLYGQLGTGDFVSRGDPTAVVGLKDAVSIAMGGGNQTCAARKSGEVLCWGSNANQQAGQSDPPVQLLPAPILDSGK